MHRKALGRGLEALISSNVGTTTLEGRPAGVKEIPIADIASNPFQPRQHFDDEAIRELVAGLIEAEQGTGMAG